MVYYVNWIYLTTGTLVTMILGALWYSPLLFAKPWMSSLGLRDGDVSESGVPALPGYLSATLYSLAITYTIGFLITNLSVSGAPAVLSVALGLWLVTSGLANLRIKYFEDRPWPLYLIDEGYALVAHLLLGLLVWLIG